MDSDARRDLDEWGPDPEETVAYGNPPEEDEKIHLSLFDRYKT